MKYLLFIILLSSSLCCRKEKINPTDFTDNGNYMTCTIDGVPWTASCEGDPLFGCDPVDCLFDSSTKDFYVIASNDLDTSGFNFVVDELHIGLNKMRYDKIFGSSMTSQCGFYSVDTTIFQSFFNVLVLDTTLSQIKGTFQFRLYNPQCSDTIIVNDGNFNLTWRPF